MEIQIQVQGKFYKVDTAESFDCAIPVASSGVTAWGVAPASIGPHREGNFIGSVKQGSAVNFNDISFNPHAHGTHTETLGHISEKVYSIRERFPLPLMPVQLITVEPSSIGEDLVVALASLKNALPEPHVPALMIRTHHDVPQIQNWSGTNPPYLDFKAAQWLAKSGVQHLLLDLPSVDREEDGGALAAHKAFWGLPEAPRMHATITELISVPDELEDGLYLLNLQVAALDNDASPSRPLLFRLIPC